MHLLQQDDDSSGNADAAGTAIVQLNPADRSLDCQLLSNNIVSTFSDEGFGYLWSGVRATHGILSGR